MPFDTLLSAALSGSRSVLLRSPASVVCAILAGSILIGTPAEARNTCNGPTLAQALLEVGRLANLQVVFNPARITGKCAPQGIRDANTLTALKRLAAAADMTVVILGPQFFALTPMHKPSGVAHSDRSAGIDAQAGTRQLQPERQQDPIVVIGQFDQSASNQWLKRLSPISVDLLSAEDVGKLPAASVAEALRLMPGVQLDNQRGLGIYFFARGLDSPFHIVQLDGRTIAINELIENGGPRGRSFRFEALPPELVSQLEVAKTASASQQEGAVGVTVNVRTPRPMDIGNRQELSVQGIANSLSEKAGGGVSGLWSWVDHDGDLGVLVSGLLRRRYVRNDRFFEFQWTKNQFPGTIDSALYTPGRVRPTIENEDRRQLSGSLSVQWRPAPDHLTEATFIASRLDVHYDEFGLDIYPDDPTYRTPMFVAGSQQVAGDTVVAGRIDDVRWMASRETSLNRHDLTSGGLRHSYTGAQWQVVADIGWSRAHSYHPDGQGTSRSRAVFFAPLQFDFSRGYRAVPSLTTNRDYSDPASFQGWTYNYAPKDSVDSSLSARIDVEYQIFGALSSIKAGLLHEARSRDYRRRDLFLDGLTGVPLNDPALGAAYYEPLPFDNFLSGFPGNTPRSWLVPTTDGFRTALLTPAALDQPLTPDDLAGSYAIDERVSTAYVQANFGFGLFGIPISGNLGVRVPHTQQISRGHVSDGIRADPVRYANTYTNILPSMNVKAELRDGLILRMAIGRSLTRPNLTDIAPRITTSLDNRTASGGNPQLRPFTATNLDAALEYYPVNGTILSVSLFQRRLNDYITSQNVPLEVPGRGIFLLSTTTNGGQAILSGSEITMRTTIAHPPMIGGELALAASLTVAYSRSRFMAGNREIRNELVGLSRHSYALNADYANGPVSVHLGYFWRSHYLNSYGTSLIGEEYVAPLGTLDGQVAWRIAQDVTLSVEGANLTSAHKFLFGTSQVQPKEINDFGRTFFFTLRWKGKSQ